jgi:hypothetical protein
MGVPLDPIMNSSTSERLLSKARADILQTVQIVQKQTSNHPIPAKRTPKIRAITPTLVNSTNFLSRKFGPIHRSLPNPKINAKFGLQFGFWVWIYICKTGQISREPPH